MEVAQLLFSDMMRSSFRSDHSVDEDPAQNLESATKGPLELFSIPLRQPVSKSQLHLSSLKPEL